MAVNLSLSGTTLARLGLEIRSEFPIFGADPKRGPLSFLDSAASSQKPKVVINRMCHYLSTEHANIHRGAYHLSAEATELYERTRLTVGSFLGVRDPRSIVFTKNATEAINLVAHSYGELLNDGDSILLTELEHHSNIVPWQLLSQRKKIKLIFASIKSDATLNFHDFKEKFLQFKPKLIAVTAQSNAFGTVTPLEAVLELARQHGAKVLIDGSQRVVHAPVNLSRLDPDFYVFTGHKVYGPTGVGVLYGRTSLLEEMPPFLGGGDMISQVTTEGSSWAEYPRRFEAGTPPIAEVIGLDAALQFMMEIGFDKIQAHEKQLFEKAIELLRSEPGITVYGPKDQVGAQSSIISFNLKGVHPHDLATIADSVNVQIRSGHHCAMPAMKALGIHGAARASLAVYSDISDFERLVEAIRRAKKVFGV